MPTSNESPRMVMHSSADKELLIRNVLEAVGARRNVMSKRSRSRELELLLRDMPPVGSVTEEKTSPPASQPAGGTPPLTDDLWHRGQCFSCGFHGHGVNRCSQLDISFPYKMPGWSVNVRNGQYRASRMRGDGQDRRPGKEGWFGQEGQPPGPSMTVTHLTQGMWPAGISGPARRMAPVDGSDVNGSSAIRPLSVEAVEFSPALVPENNVMFGWKTLSSGAGGVAPAVVADPCADSGGGDVLGGSGGPRVGFGD